jgi:hypothetical protein
MKPVSNRKALDYSLKESRKEIVAALLPIIQRINGYLLGEAASDGTIQPRNAERVQAQVGEWVLRFFVGDDLRRPYDEDGVTPLAPFPRILNKWYVYAVYAEVEHHRRWLAKHLPGDLYVWLASSRRSFPIEEMTRMEYLRALAKERQFLMGDGEPERVGPLVAESDNPYVRLPEEPVEHWRRRMADLRIFAENPLAEIDPERRWVPMHQWQDARGYTLSRRIWDAGRNTQAKIDALLAEGIRNGDSAQVIAKRLEQFVRPDRANLRTQKPYGINGSFDAMRLARSEIARAHSHASYIASLMNPYVNEIEVARSRNGDPKCPVCPRYATLSMDGSRLRPAYSVYSAVYPIFHPHCKCYTFPVVVDSPEAVTARLRAVMEDSRVDRLTPALNPAGRDAFVQRLVGESLMGMMRQVTQLPLF